MLACALRTLNMYRQRCMYSRSLGQNSLKQLDDSFYSSYACSRIELLFTRFILTKIRRL